MALTKNVAALLLGAVSVVGLSGAAIANPVFEGEGVPMQNDTFETRQTVAPGSTDVVGELGLVADPTEYDYSFTGNLRPDQADFITVPDLPPNEPFYVWIDNSASGVDTVIGVLDGDQNPIATDDDSSPVGTGVASGVGSTVAADGTVNIGVSGFPDFNFDGMYDATAEFQPPIVESETFQVPSGDYELYVQLGVESPESADLTSPDYTFPGSIVPGEVNTFTIPDVDASQPFYAWINNEASGVDTVLGVFDSTGTLVLSDDDGSPVGSGLASGLVGTASADGTIELRVTGFPDYDFDGEYEDDMAAASDPTIEATPDLTMPPDAAMTGPHGMEGEYEVFVKLGVDRLTGDVDFLSFPDLEPGSEFTVEVILANFDSVLGWFADDGSLVAMDDDGGIDTLSRITGTVPESGILTFAITAYGDDFQGTHSFVSDYVLRLETSSAE